MDEARSVFNSTNSERSRLKNAAYHKKNGSAVQKLGNKRMSWQEIQSRHGEAKTYKSTDGFMEYSDFEELPSDLKVEYVNKMMDRYDIQLCHLSKYLFNKGDDGLKANLRQIFTLIDGKNVRLLDLCDYKKPRAMTGLLRFQADVEDWRKRTKIAEMLDREAEEARKNTPAEFNVYYKYKAMRDEDKVCYINKLIRQWGVSPEVISVELFEKSRATVRAYLNKHGYGKQLIEVGKRPPDASLAINKRFHDAVQQWKVEMLSITPREESVNMKALGTIIELGIAGVEEEPVKEPVIEAKTDIPTPAIETAPKKPAEEKTRLEQQIEERSRLIDILHSRPLIGPDNPKSQFRSDEEKTNLNKQIDDRAKELEKKIFTKDVWPFATSSTPDEVKEEVDISVIPLELNTGWYEPIKEPETDPREFCDMNFSMSCVRNGIDMNLMYLLDQMIKNDRIKMELTIIRI